LRLQAPSVVELLPLGLSRRPSHCGVAFSCLIMLRVQVNAVEAASEMQPRLVLRHVIRSVDSTVQSTVPLPPTFPCQRSILLHHTAPRSLARWRLLFQPRVIVLAGPCRFFLLNQTAGPGHCFCFAASCSVCCSADFRPLYPFHRALSSAWACAGGGSGRRAESGVRAVNDR